MTALGAAIAAGLAAGVWSDVSQVPSHQTLTFLPSISSDGVCACTHACSDGYLYIIYACRYVCIHVVAQLCLYTDA